jgi:hypothetical protein
VAYVITAGAALKVAEVLRDVTPFAWKSAFLDSG